MPSVAIPDGELSYELYGNGSDVVVSGQWTFRVGTYQQLLAESSDRWRVYAVTLRGYGTSMPRTPDLGEGWYDTWADDIYCAARAWGLQQFIYTGASHGAGVGWHLALRHPESLRSFVSVAGAPKDRTVVRSPEERARAIAARANGPSPLRPDWPERPLPQARTNDELAALLTRVHVPTLLIAGARDDIISLPDTLRALVSVRGATAVIYEEAGHSVSVDRASDIVRQFTLFADRDDRRPGDQHHVCSLADDAT